MTNQFYVRLVRRTRVLPRYGGHPETADSIDGGFPTVYPRATRQRSAFGVHELNRQMAGLFERGARGSDLQV